MPKFMTIHRVVLTVTTTTDAKDNDEAHATANLAILQTLKAGINDNIDPAPGSSELTSLNISENRLVSLERADAPVLTKLERAGERFFFEGKCDQDSFSGDVGTGVIGSGTGAGGMSGTSPGFIRGGDKVVIQAEVSRVIKEKYNVEVKW